MQYSIAIYLNKILARLEIADKISLPILGRIIKENPLFVNSN